MSIEDPPSAAEPGKRPVPAGASSGRVAPQIVAAAALVAGWAGLHLAGAFWLLHWRVVNEPGAGPGRVTLACALILAVAGAAGFAGGNLYLVATRSRAVLIAWGLCVGVTVAAVALSPILLLLLV